MTFSQAQQALIEDLLDQARRDDPSLEPFFADAVDEPVFVKNLENVQGDERDVILFSVCYGPDVNGKVAMNFGPLNAAGGERRLNVAVTRARRQVVVHATLRPEQIDLTRTNALGVKHLKSFLDYAARGPAAIAEAVTLDGEATFDSPFERQVHDALVAKGHDVVKQVGCSGYRIDLAVRDPEAPGRFLLGIECDGAFYHSARTARDRDRLRESVLRGLGWRLVRVWSTDWWRSPDKQIARLEEAIAAARREAPTPSPAPAKATEAPQAAAPVAEEPPPADDAPPLYVAVAVEGSLGDANALHEAQSTPAIADLARRVLEVEGPVAVEVLCRRVAAGFDARTTARVRERVMAIVRRLPKGERPLERDGFLWPSRLDPDGWRGFRASDAEGSAPRDADEIAVEEIANAAAFVLKQQVALPREALVRETARVLGFARVGNKVGAAIGRGVDRMVERGDGVVDGQSVALSESP